MMRFNDHSTMKAHCAKYLKQTADQDRICVNVSMPTKLAVKRFDGQYRTKVVPDSATLKFNSVYLSKKEELILVFNLIGDNPPKELSDAKSIEIPYKIAGNRLSGASWKSFVTVLSEAAEEGLSKKDIYATPADEDGYDSSNLFGSWS